MPNNISIENTTLNNRGNVPHGGKDLRLALRRKPEQTDAFVGTYHYRSGVETTMSKYATLNSVKQSLRRL